MAFELDSRLLAQYGNPQTQSVFKDSGGSFVKGVSSGMALGNQYKEGKRAGELHNISLETAARNKEKDDYNMTLREGVALDLEAERDARKLAVTTNADKETTRKASAEVQRKKDQHWEDNVDRLTTEQEKQNAATLKATQERAETSKQQRAVYKAKEEKIEAEGVAEKIVNTALTALSQTTSVQEKADIGLAVLNNPASNLTTAQTEKVIKEMGAGKDEVEQNKIAAVTRVTAGRYIREGSVEAATAMIGSELGIPVDEIISVTTLRPEKSLAEDVLVITVNGEDKPREISMQDWLASTGQDGVTAMQFLSASETRKNQAQIVADRTDRQTLLTNWKRNVQEDVVAAKGQMGTVTTTESNASMAGFEMAYPDIASQYSADEKLAIGTLLAYEERKYLGMDFTRAGAKEVAFEVFSMETRKKKENIIQAFISGMMKAEGIKEPEPDKSEPEKMEKTSALTARGFDARAKESLTNLSLGEVVSDIPAAVTSGLKTGEVREVRNKATGTKMKITINEKGETVEVLD
jgi:hypothetical protein